jgi:hypothetical protein
MVTQFFFETIGELRGFSCSAHSIVLTVNFSTQGKHVSSAKNVQHVKHFLSKIWLWMTDLSPPGSQHNSSKLNKSANAGRDHFRGEAALYVLVSLFTHDYSLVLPVPVAARSKA